MYCFYISSFNATNKKLQSVEIDLNTVLNLYNGFNDYLVEIRNDFDHFENMAITITECSKYDKDFKRNKKRNVKIKFEI